MSHIKFDNLSFAYEEGANLILKDITVEVADGEFVCILGQSGCGKSTLLRLLTGLEKPTAGVITIDGNRIEGAGLDKGVVFQDYGLFPWMTAGENILLALKQKFPERDKKELKQTAVDMIRAVGLEESIYRKLPKELSGGMKQRCAIAQAFSINPPILLMDEPFGALDAQTRVVMQELLAKISRETKNTILFITHDIDEAILLADKIYVMSRRPGTIREVIDVNIEGERNHEILVKPEFLAMKQKIMNMLWQESQDAALGK